MAVSTEADSTASKPLASLTLAPPSVTTSSLTAGLLSGQMWTGATVTFSFPAAGASWPGYDAGSEPFVGFTALNAAQQNAFRGAIAAWDQLIAPSLVEVADPAGPGQIRVGFSGHSSLSGATAGHAYEPPAPGATADPRNGDVWINASEVSAPFTPGTDPYDTFLHEIGHALGLKHPFEAPVLPAAFENKRFTLMSYTEAQDSRLVTVLGQGGGVQFSAQSVHASTPLVLDIAAIQQRYGADPTTATGNNTYTYSEGQAFFMAIYDAGGVDTIDLSSFTRGSDVDLAPGGYSSIGLYTTEAQIAAAVQQFPGAEAFIRSQFADVGAAVYTWSNNLGIAFTTVIENATGGAAADTLTGNDVDNLLSGLAGADFIRGLSGNDTVDGGAGNDDINGNQGQDIVRGGAGADFVRGGQGDDTVYGEADDDVHVNGNIGADMVYGGEGNDTLFGGQGTDTLFGEGGNDWLSGDLGADVLLGGAGADRFLFRVGSGADWAGDFNAAEGDLIQLAPGVAYTAISVSGQVGIDLGNGDVLGLTGVAFAGFSASWIVFV